MSFFENLFPGLWFGEIGEQVGVYSDSFLQNLSQSMSNSTCGGADEDSEGCRNDSFALIHKMVAIAVILIAGVCGVAIPLVGKKRRFLQTDSNLFVSAKAFAAGVILATGFVHMLPDAASALMNSCLPKLPWSKFPFSGFIAMIASLATLLVDFLGTQYYERKQENESPNVEFDSSDMVSELGIVPVEKKRGSAKVFGEEEGGVKEELSLCCGFEVKEFLYQFCQSNVVIEKIVKWIELGSGLGPFTLG